MGVKTAQKLHAESERKIEEYKTYAGPLGRVVAARIRGYKQRIVILCLIMAFEAGVIVGLVRLFFKYYQGG